MADVTVALDHPVLFQSAAEGDTEIEYSAVQFRALPGALFYGQGVARYGELRMEQRAAGANWSVDILAGRALVGGPTGYDMYVVVLAETLNVPLTGLNTEPAAERTHRVFVAVADELVSGTGYGASIVVTEDTGSGAGEPDAVAFIELGTITIAPGQSSILDAHLDYAPEVVEAAGRPQRPIVSNMVSEPPFDDADTEVAFTTGAWPRPQFTVPDSAMAWVTVSARIKNDNSAISYIYVGYDFNIEPTGFSFLKSAVSNQNGGWISATRRYLWTWPAGNIGDIVTVTPTWLISDGDAADNAVAYGQIVIEPVP